MRGCPRSSTFRGCRLLATSFILRPRRSFCTRNHERVEVPCGSSGRVTIDLLNIENNPPCSPFFIHLPPFPRTDGVPAPLPEFLQGKPVASINYRWTPPAAADSAGGDSDEVSQWPMPIHDTCFAYSWLVDQFAPEGQQRRDIYVYGSHLGGSLATSLSLTETHPHKRFSVRGVISYNGVYNWTMFLPDHPVNRPSKRAKNPMSYLSHLEGTHLHRIQELLPNLFRSPEDMFDAFASPGILFHNPGLLVPSSYTISEVESAALEAMINPNSEACQPKVPRKSHLMFPPRASTLKIPESLFLYDSPTVVASAKKGRRRLATSRGNTMENQARELVELMRRSIEKVELKERSKWDEDLSGLEDETARRIQGIEVGDERESLDLNQVGEEAIQEWLADRIGE
ncbi:hypothetical protein B0J13DRAFT_246800 [Dactylonectria estremocensis]|uniref:Alpha/beta hydrolase fold-3 domain-containing protein n=1 Tax=Dactylonectria estremocensis TaxID=1079267 RepID=A0A9P9F2F6_9HYPO|nr:hypothetical protein B0J13DRAFT_246800 [Dactylonectria estremocensis]